MYAKIITEHRIDTNAPSTIIVEGAVIVNPTKEQYALAGWYPFHPSPEPEHHIGWHNVATFAIVEDYIQQSWHEEKDPEPVPVPRVFSKYKIVCELDAIGKLDALLDFVESDRALKAKWESAQTLSEEDPNFERAKALAKTVLGLTDDEIEDLLNRCIAE